MSAFEEDMVSPSGDDKLDGIPEVVSELMLVVEDARVLSSEDVEDKDESVGRLNIAVDSLELLCSWISEVSELIDEIAERLEDTVDASELICG